MSLDTEQESVGTMRRGRFAGSAVVGAMNNPRSVRPSGSQEAQGLANFIGWFSIGLGIAEIVGTHQLTELIGVKPTRKNKAVMQAMGVREIVKGVGILVKDRPTDWLWGRVAGDMLDVALLGRALSSHSKKPERTTAAIGAVLGVAALDVFTAQALASGQKLTRSRAEDGNIRVQRTVTVRISPEEAYRFWADFQNLPKFMRHLDSVQQIGEGRTRWSAKALGEKAVEWDVEILENRPNELISWRSAEGMPVTNSGTVHFRAAPGDRGTEVRMEMEYDPPLGQLGATLAKLFREEPGQQVRDDLTRFKQLMEVGEILVSDGTLQRGPRPAQPSSEPQQGNVSPASPL
ncbi:hypothetical protein BH23GEM6_BH23GEM6_21010 [soil metagenome]